MIFGAATLVAVGAAAFFLFQTEQQIARLKSTLRAFDVRAREATTALADLRVAQQAYVAEGQGVDFWMPKVASLHQSITGTLAALRQSPVSGGASTALDEAVATVAEFGNIDRRTRDYITSDEKLMAADVIFTESGEAVANAARQIETARLAEHQAADLAEAALRKKEALAAGAAASFAVLVVLAADAASAGRGRGTRDDRLVYLSYESAYERGRERPHDRGARESTQGGPCRSTSTGAGDDCGHSTCDRAEGGGLARDRLRPCPRRRRDDPAPRPRRDADGRQRRGHLARHDHGHRARAHARARLWRAGAVTHAESATIRRQRRCRRLPHGTDADCARHGRAATLARWWLRFLPPMAASARSRPKSRAAAKRRKACKPSRQSSPRISRRCSPTRVPRQNRRSRSRGRRRDSR